MFVNLTTTLVSHSQRSEFISMFLIQLPLLFIKYDVMFDVEA